MEIGRMQGDEFEIACDEYLGAMNRDVIEVALELLGREHSIVCKRLVRRLL